MQSIHGHAPRLRKASRARVAFAVIVGSALEWYDFFLFGLAAATIFNKVFFPSSVPLLGTLAAFSTFAIGFIARPLGGILLAAWSDKYGRQSVLILTLVMMGVMSTLVGVIPSYAQLGILAPILLVILRILQGIGAGAEYAVAAVYALEHHDDRHRGVAGALPGIGVYLGLVLATLSLQLASSLSGNAFLSWGWRLPFLASAVLLVFGICMRRALGESPEFEQAKAAGKTSGRPLRDLLRHEWRAVLTVFGAQLAQTGLGYLYMVFGLFYLTDVLHLSRATALETSLVSSIIAIFTVPVAGWLGNRFGYRRSYLIALVICIVAALVFFPMLDTRQPLWIHAAMILAVSIGAAPLVAVQGAYFSSCFSTSVRTSGFVLGRELSVAVGGGFTPLTAMLLFKWGGVPAVTLFAVALGSVSLLVVTFSRAGRTPVRGADLRATSVNP